MWIATLFAEKKIMICANKLQTAIEIMDRLRLAYEYLPQWIKPGIVVYNKQEITFSNKSTIRAFSTSSSASRGFSGQIMIIDEMAFIPKNIIDEFFASVMPVVSSAKDSKVIVVSTPNGTSGLYYDIWQQANSNEEAKNKEGWKPFRVDWFEVPGRTKEWKEKQIASIGIEKWNQEFGNEFSSGSDTRRLVPDDLIERYRMEYARLCGQGGRPGKKQVVMSKDQTKAFEFRMFRPFERDRAYAATADVAEGVGGDYSVLYIWDVTEMANIRLCAAFTSNSASLVEFAYVASRMLKLYCDPWLFVERNGVSAGMIDSLRITYGYQNVAPEGKNGLAGVYSHMTGKEKACLYARTMFTTEGYGFELPDKDLIDEMGFFVKKENKGVHAVYAAPRPAHDDRMMTLVWLCYAMQPEIVEKYFVVTKRFTTQLDQTYPATLAPQKPYDGGMLRKVSEDPIYIDFMDFYDGLKDKARELAMVEIREKATDVFKYTDDDMYFGGSWTGNEWGRRGQAMERDNGWGGAHAPVYFL